RVNDDFGHLAGDYVLKKVANEVSRRIRKEECFARYGGEEFTIVLPDTPIDRGKILAEKIRALVEATTFEFEDVIIPVTVSMGIASLKDSGQHPGMNTSGGEPVEESGAAEGLIRRADECMFFAKRAGRNRIICEGDNLIADSKIERRDRQRVLTKTQFQKYLKSLTRGAVNPEETAVISSQPVRELGAFRLCKRSTYLAEDGGFTLDSLDEMLGDAIIQCIGVNDGIGRYDEGLWLVALHGESEPICARIKETFSSYVKRQNIEAKIEMAAAGIDYSVTEKENIALLIGILESSSHKLDQPKLDHPTPIMLARQRIDAETSIALRYDAVTRFAEVCLRYIFSHVAADLCYNHGSRVCEATWNKLSRYLEKDVSLGGWHELCYLVCKECVKIEGECVSTETAEILAKKRHGSTRLYQQISTMVESRNSLRHKDVSEEKYAEALTTALPVVAELMRAMASTCQVPVVVIRDVKIRPRDKEAVFHYQIRRFIGGTQFAPVVEWKSNECLENDRAYWLRNRDGLAIPTDPFLVVSGAQRPAPIIMAISKVVGGVPKYQDLVHGDDVDIEEELVSAVDQSVAQRLGIREG
ncbi:MAG: GGDEF domain-containing protein, partial [Pseudomonadota bacterium]